MNNMVVLVPAAARENFCFSRPQPADNDAEPRTRRIFPMMEPESEAFTTSNVTRSQSEHRNDQLGRVTEGRIQDAADGRARYARRALP